MMCEILFFKFCEYIGEVEVLHVDVSILKILIEGSDFIEDLEMMNGCLKEIIDEVLE